MIQLTFQIQLYRGTPKNTSMYVFKFQLHLKSSTNTNELPFSIGATGAALHRKGIQTTNTTSSRVPCEGFFVAQFFVAQFFVAQFFVAQFFAAF